MYQSIASFNSLVSCGNWISTTVYDFTLSHHRERFGLRSIANLYCISILIYMCIYADLFVEVIILYLNCL